MDSKYEHTVRSESTSSVVWLMLSWRRFCPHRVHSLCRSHLSLQFSVVHLQFVFDLFRVLQRRLTARHLSLQTDHLHNNRRLISSLSL